MVYTNWRMRQGEIEGSVDIWTLNKSDHENVNTWEFSEILGKV